LARADQLIAPGIDSSGLLVPWKDDPSAALALDFDLIPASHLFMRVTRRGVRGSFGPGALHLLPKE
jgi:hypothetical protein